MILAHCLRNGAKRLTIEVQTQSGAQTIERGGLGLHLVLGEIRDKIEQALVDRDLDGVWENLKLYYEWGTGNSIGECESFEQFAHSLVLLRQLNTLQEIPPFMESSVRERHQKSVAWDYEGRAAFMVVHLIARTYGWSVEEVVGLVPEVGFALVNEILVDEQLSQEWEYGLSEVSRVYDKATKRTRFRPLPRPLWMVGRAADLVMNIPKSVLPQGNVVELWDAAKRKSQKSN